MNKVHSVAMCLLILGCVSREDDKSAEAVRVRFVPDAAVANSLNPTTGAHWTQLRPFPNPDSETLQLFGWAGIGQKFPVGTEAGVTLFEVLLKDGNDDRLSLEIVSDHGSEPIKLRRDKTIKVEVNRVEYELKYPTVEMASTAKQETTTQAMVLVSTRRK